MDDRLFRVLDLIKGFVLLVVCVPGVFLAVWGLLALFIPPLRGSFLSLTDAIDLWLFEW